MQIDQLGLRQGVVAWEVQTSGLEGLAEASQSSVLTGKVGKLRTKASR